MPRPGRRPWRWSSSWPGRRRTRGSATRPRASSGALSAPWPIPPSRGRGDPEEVRVSSDRHVAASTRQADGHLRLTVRVASNGCNFLVIGREKTPRNGNEGDR